MVFSQNKKPHLIVGNWKEIRKNNNDPSQIGNRQDLEQWYFGSDEKTSHLTTFRKDTEWKFAFIYKILPNKENPNQPFLQLIDNTKKKQVIVFKIVEISKTILVLQLEEGKTKSTLLLPSKPIEFKRIAGPPENME
jgi:hypothetical protein